MNIILLSFSLLIALQVAGCENKSKINEIEIKSKWMSLYLKTGCLTGGQHWGPGTSEGSIFQEKEWQSFFKLSPKLTIPFLMNRIGSTNETKVHVCPFHMSTEGELAVYASEHILKKNWFDIDGKYKHLTEWSDKREGALTPVTKLMLGDIQAKNELKSYFLAEIK